jgi:hypothetical protein
LGTLSLETTGTKKPGRPRNTASPRCPDDSINGQHWLTDAWLNQLGAELMSDRLSERCFRRELIHLISARLHVHRIRLWRLHALVAEPCLEKVGGWCVETGDEAIGERLDISQGHIGATYLETLESYPLLFSAEPLDVAIRSGRSIDGDCLPVLHVAVLINGRIRGVVQCWRDAAHPCWKPGETTQLRKILATVGLIVARYEHQAAGRQLIL